MAHNDDKPTGKQPDDGPRTLGGHASHVGGLKLLLLIIIGYLIWKLVIR